MYSAHGQFLEQLHDVQYDTITDTGRTYRPFLTLWSLVIKQGPWDPLITLYPHKNSFFLKTSTVIKICNKLFIILCIRINNCLNHFYTFFIIYGCWLMFLQLVWDTSNAKVTSLIPKQSVCKRHQFILQLMKTYPVSPRLMELIQRTWLTNG